VPLSLDQGGFVFFFRDIKNWQSFPNILAKLVKFILGKKNESFSKNFTIILSKKQQFLGGKKSVVFDTLPCILSGSIFIKKFVNRINILSSFILTQYCQL
jgi:hypothetical protein